MRLSITVIPKASGTRIAQVGPNAFRVSVPAPPEGGQANAAVLAALAEHFGVARSRVRIVRGGKSRSKLIEIG